MNPERKRVLDEIADLGWPLFVKPARGGSSIGTSKAHDLAQLRESIAVARQYDPKVLIEAAVDGREVEVAVLEGENGAPPDTSLPGQLLIDGGEEFWDFEAKYLDAASGMAIPAPIPEGATQEIRRLAALVFDAVSCEGLARVDFFYTTRRRDPGQRDQHDPRAVAGLLLPEDVGGQRRGVPAAHRPAAADGAAQAPRPALATARPGRSPSSDARPIGHRGLAVACGRRAGLATWLALSRALQRRKGPTMTLRGMPAQANADDRRPPAPHARAAAGASWRPALPQVTCGPRPPSCRH